MKPSVHSSGPRIPNVVAAAIGLLAGLACFLVQAAGAGQAAPLRELHTAEQVRQLTPEQAARHYPVKLRGVLTFFDESQFYRFVQDGTAGIYLFGSSDTLTNPALATGELVEVEGETNPGQYAPTVTPNRINILGPGKFPPAKPVTYEDLVSGKEDSQFVSVQGVVRNVTFDPQTRYNSIDIATGGGRLTALAKHLPVQSREDLVDSTVNIRGVCLSRFNLQRQLFDLRLLVPYPSDIEIEQPAPAHPFDVPTRSIEQLLQFTPRGPFGHRVKVEGTVIYRRGPKTLYIEDHKEGLYVQTEEAGALLPGDRVEVLGFPSKGEYTPMLRDAVFRKIGSGPVPVPDPVTVDEALSGTHDCRLVRIVATVLNRTRYGSAPFLVLESSNFIFNAYLQRNNPGVDFAYLKNGSKVAITGVCLIEPGNNWHPGADWRAKSFRILLRSAGDIFVLKEPPWWNLQKLLWAIGVLVVIVLFAFAWVAILGRRVNKQTGIIRQKLQTEAALKERYEELFENANDMVFTHDLTGRMTSINRMGERLLWCSRQEILSKNVADLVVAEQRPDVHRWLEQVVQGVELPPAEWDFVNGAGQRLRLEISTRIVGQQGRQVEVEGIARDITERKRLEREILEISNREQQRMGHDLHDGVCQQLAGIAYRIDILADQLQEKQVTESSEAEHIGTLVNDAITQARGIARGLFPVRLQESGLALALEDLSTNTAQLFKIKCECHCEEPLPALENGVALHLYYIVQEATLNAAKHGRASHVKVSLAHHDHRLSVAIEDNGCGFELSAGNPHGMGIRIMRYRARMIGATLELKSQPGQGTQVMCTAYLPSEAPGQPFRPQKGSQRVAADTRQETIS